MIVENLIQIKSGITINAVACLKIQKKKKILVCKKDYVWNPAICSYKSVKYLAGIIDDSVITGDKIIDTTKVVPTKTVLTKSTLTNFYILLTFLLITTALLIFVSIYSYLIKHKSKQKYLLPYYVTNNKVNKVLC